MQKQNLQAGRAFEKAADIQNNKLNEPSDAANAMVDVSQAYIQSHRDSALAVTSC